MKCPARWRKFCLKRELPFGKATPLVQLDVSELQAERKRLEVQKELNIKISERLKALYDREGVSLQEYEVAKAEVEKVKAEIALNDAQVEKTDNKGAIQRQIGLAPNQRGQLPLPRQPYYLAGEYQPHTTRVLVPERYSQVVKPGTRVQFKLDGVAGNFNATVAAAEPNIDAATRTYKLKASAPNDRGLIFAWRFLYRHCQPPILCGNYYDTHRKRHARVGRQEGVCISQWQSTAGSY